MSQFQVNLPERHDSQERVVAEAKRFNVLSCGRRWGKSTLGIDRIVHTAVAGHPTAWFAPSYKNLAESWREMLRALGPMVIGQNATERRISLAGGGAIEFWSLDSPDIADSVRGRKYALAIVDEAATVRDLLEVWQRVIRPTLADYRGSAWFLSTPRGFNGFQSFYARGQDAQNAEWMSWQMPTASNPHIEPDEIESMRREMTEAAFTQEVLAEFVSFEGAVFRRITDAATVPLGLQPDMEHQYVIGVDWGRSIDFTVIAVVDVTDRALVALDRSNRVDYYVQRERLHAAALRWMPARIIAEQNSIGQPIIEQLRRDGLNVQPFTTTNATKAEAIEGLALAFERGEIKIIPDPVLLAELQSFQSEILPSGQTRYSAISGAHDDTVMALAIAWQGGVAKPKSSGLYIYEVDLGGYIPQQGGLSRMLGRGW